MNVTACGVCMVLWYVVILTHPSPVFNIQLTLYHSVLD